jgi:regulatory protein
VAFGAPSLKGRALRWLSQREHSRAELARKLARHAAGAVGSEDADAGDARAEIERVLDELAAAGLLSDARAAESVLSVQGARHGVRRLEQSLRAKGLEAALVAQTLAVARGTEFDRALAVFRRRFGDAPATEPAERARQMRFLAARGFETDVVRRVLRVDAD